MSKPNPILNLRDLFETITGILFWRFEFFNPIQFAILIVLFTLMLFKFKSIPTFYKEFGTIALMGLLVYLIGLGKQLIHHDYYFLSSFLPLILLIASMLSKRLLQVSPNAVKLLLFPIAIAISIPSFMQATARQQDHFTIRDNTLDNDLTWLKNGAKKLDNMGVGPNEIIFVLYDFAPNTSLVYFNRKGLVFNHEQMSRKEPHIEFWIEKLKPDYLIVKSDWENAFFENKPEIARKWNRIPQDGFILYKKP